MQFEEICCGLQAMFRGRRDHMVRSTRDRTDVCVASEMLSKVLAYYQARDAGYR